MLFNAHKTHKAKKQVDRFLAAPITGEEAGVELQKQIINTIEHAPMEQPTPAPQPLLPPQPPRAENRLRPWHAFVPIAGIAVAVFAFVLTMQREEKIDTTISLARAELGTFASAEEFSTYLAKGDQANAGFLARDFVMQAAEVFDQGDDRVIMSSESSLASGYSKVAPTSDPERFSSTNVQVQGIDEPDSVKTDGTNLFISPETYGYRRLDFVEIEEDSKIAAPQEARTFDIRALPVSDITTENIIDKGGELLLVDNTLLVFGTSSVAGYDVSEKTAERKWEYEYGENTGYFTARLIDSTVYLVTSTYVSPSSSCPIVALKKVDQNAAEVRCDRIYHPIAPTPVDTAYTITKFDAATGVVQDTVGFTGGYATIVYMSPTSIYLTYNIEVDSLAVMEKFLNSPDVRDVVGDDVRNRLVELQTYDLSEGAKISELMLAIGEKFAAIPEDQLEERGEKFEEASQRYAEEHKRELQQTGIARFDLDSLDLAATGTLPGEPLNQFSLDEYENHLRLTTTVGGSFIPLLDPTESVNDLIIFDADLKQVSTVQDLGKGERIYSTRFVGDVAYMVTFRQIDPFFVFDLSDSKNPRVRGELKIPGFSSYLHPISETRVLGIGQEDGQVKATLFDVSNLDEPKELSTLKIENAFWTEVQNTHHAFLLDADRQIFFMPADQKGYVISYEGDTLMFKKETSGVQATRAVYINEYLYVIGPRKFKVFSEETWEEVAEYVFSKS